MQNVIMSNVSLNHASGFERNSNATIESFVLLSILSCFGNLHHCSCLGHVTTCNSDIADNELKSVTLSY